MRGQILLRLSVNTADHATVSSRSNGSLWGTVVPYWSHASVLDGIWYAVQINIFHAYHKSNRGFIYQLHLPYPPSGSIIVLAI